MLLTALLLLLKLGTYEYCLKKCLNNFMTIRQICNVRAISKSTLFNCGGKERTD